MPAAAAIPYIFAAGQALAGIFTNKGSRPQYRIPGEAREALSTARTLSLSGTRPGNDQALADIDRNFANTVGVANRVAGGASQVLGTVDRAGIARGRQIGQNNALNSQFAFNSKMNLINVLNSFSRYRDKEFELNKMAPYMQKAETKNALISAGIQNAYGAFQDQESMKILKQIYGLK